MLSTSLQAKSQRRYQRSAVRHANMRMMVDALEPRLLLAGTPTQLLTQTVLPSPYTSVQAAPSLPIIVAIADATGATVTTDNATVVMLTLAVNPAGGSLTTFSNNTWRSVGSVTATAANGIATFSNFSFSVPGQYMLNVFDSRGGLSGTQSSLFTVLAMATHLEFTVQPGDITAGNAFSPNVQVSVRDATGALVTTDTRAIRLALNSTAGTLTGVTTMNAVGGIATFTNLTETTAGAFTLQARESSTTGTLTQATSFSFSVSPGPAANLVFEQQPVNTLQGEAFGVVVDVIDRLGNLVVADTSTVTLSVAMPASTLINGVLSLTALTTNGKATFNSLYISLPGDYVLNASAGSLTSVNSNNFAIIGAPSELAIINLPTQTTMGQIMSPGVIVAVWDVGRHIVINSNATITLAIGTGPGTLSGTTTLQAINGTVSFSDLSFSDMGTYTLVATSGTLTQAQTDPFIINGTAAQLAFLVEPTSPSSNSPFGLVVEVQDTAGHRVVDATSTVTISKENGPGNLSGVTQVAAVNGTASFSSLKLSAAGTYTLQAASGDLTIAVTDPFVVLLAATRVVFAQQPSSVASGATMYPAVTVQIQNDAGETATTNTSSVTLAILSGPDNATIGGSITVTAVAGVATFSNLAFGVLGQYTLVAYSGDLTADTSTSFWVTPAANKLRWGVQPQERVTAGDVLSRMTVYVEEAGGDRVNSSHAVVTLTISSGPTGGSLTLNGSTVANATTNADHGVATFNGVSFTKVGTYILNAASSGLTAVKSKSFAVTVDSASGHLVILKSPTSTLVGADFALKVVVNVADQFGNVIHANNSPVTLFISSGTGGTLSGSTTLKAKKGVATFYHIRVNQAGSYVVSATSAGLPDMTPATFALTVTPVVSTVAKPWTKSCYAAGTDFALTSQLRGVKSSSAPWTGEVNLVTSDDVVLPTTTELTPKGKVKMSVAGLTAGTYTVHLRYAGDDNHHGGVSRDFTLVVGPSTKTHVDYTVTGTTLDLNLQVTSRGASTDRTGTLQILENGTLNTSAVLSGSQASISLEPGIGRHTYTVVYPGDISFRGSTKSVTVDIGTNSRTTVTASDTTLHVGDSLTLSVAVSPATGSAVPTGFVQLLENGTLNQTTTLSGADATFTLAPTLGTHTYAVVYQGDDAFIASTSKTLKVAIGREATAVDLTASATSITYGTTFTIDADVSALNDTTTARTGMLVLKDGSSIVAAMNLNGSTSATFTITPLAGTHAYTVSYVGDGNFLGSAATARLTVVRDVTTVTGTPSSDEISAGTVFRIDALVEPDGAATAGPTGVVQLQENGVTIRTLTLNSGSGGTFWLTPVEGDHSFRLVYMGDANFESSVSSTIELTVT